MKFLMPVRRILSSKFNITLLHLTILSPVCTLPGLISEQAQAFEVAGGLAAVEEGDDRLRPAFALHAALDDFYAARMYYYGREFGPIREDTLILSAHRRFSLFRTNIIKAQMGIALMDEITKVSYSGSADKDKNEEEHNTNIGGAAGISIALPANLAPFYAQFSWDSHVFPAGLGGILLSTGRKQTLSLVAGMLF
jgi:hypothetical protein